MEKVTPAIYDISLKSKGTRDENSVKMLDLIFANRVMDFAYVYGGWGEHNPSVWLGFVLKKDTTDIASHNAKHGKAFEEKMGKIFTYFIEEND